METLHDKLAEYFKGKLTIDQLNDWLHWAAFQASKPWDIDFVRQHLTQYNDRINVNHLLQCFRQFNRKIQIVTDIQQCLDRILAQWSGETANEALILELIGHLEAYVAPLERSDRFKPYLRVCYRQLSPVTWQFFNRSYFEGMQTTLATIRRNTNS